MKKQKRTLIEFYNVTDDDDRQIKALSEQEYIDVVRQGLFIDNKYRWRYVGSIEI